MEPFSTWNPTWNLDQTHNQHGFEPFEVPGSRIFDLRAYAHARIHVRAHSWNLNNLEPGTWNPAGESGAVVILDRCGKRIGVARLKRFRMFIDVRNENIAYLSAGCSFGDASGLRTYSAEAMGEIIHTVRGCEILRVLQKRRGSAVYRAEFIPVNKADQPRAFVEVGPATRAFSDLLARRVERLSGIIFLGWLLRVRQGNKQQARGQGYKSFHVSLRGFCRILRVL